MSTPSRVKALKASGLSSSLLKLNRQKLQDAQYKSADWPLKLTFRNQVVPIFVGISFRDQVMEDLCISAAMNKEQLQYAVTGQTLKDSVVPMEPRCSLREVHMDLLVLHCSDCLHSLYQDAD